MRNALEWKHSPRNTKKVEAFTHSRNQQTVVRLAAVRLRVMMKKRWKRRFRVMMKKRRKMVSLEVRWSEGRWRRSELGGSVEVYGGREVRVREEEEAGVCGDVKRKGNVNENEKWEMTLIRFAFYKREWEWEWEWRMLIRHALWARYRVIRYREGGNS